MILSRPHTGTVTKSGSKNFLTWIRTQFLLYSEQLQGKYVIRFLPVHSFFSSPSRPTSHPGSVYNTDPDPIHILINHPALCQFQLSIHNLFSLLRVRIRIRFSLIFNSLQPRTEPFSHPFQLRFRFPKISFVFHPNIYGSGKYGHKDPPVEK